MSKLKQKAPFSFSFLVLFIYLAYTPELVELDNSLQISAVKCVIRCIKNGISNNEAKLQGTSSGIFIQNLIVTDDYQILSLAFVSDLYKN